MIFLEIAMIAIGLAFIFYSVRISDTSENISIEGTDEVPLADQETEEERLQGMLDSFTQKAESIYDDLDNRMSQISNEKIMGISEYSDQVIEKIEKNHDEVVFLYDMMNEKQEEVKSLVHEIDSLRADLHDESAREYQKMREQGMQLDEMKKAIELDILELQSAGQERGNTISGEEDFTSTDVLEDSSESTSLTKEADTSVGGEEDIPSVYDAEIARIEEEEAKAEKSVEDSEFVNHNDEIIALYKKGRNILDISKMLSLGQGEVKFVIDLYNAR